MRLDRIIIATLIIIALSELILKILYPELIVSQTYLPVQVSVTMISLWLLLIYFYSLGKKKLFDLITAISIIMIFIVMLVIVLFLPEISFSWLFLLLIFFFSVITIHSFLKGKITMKS